MPSARARLEERLSRLAKKDPFFAEAGRLARDTGTRLLLVGGAIRDAALGIAPRDVDFIVMGRRRRRFLDLLARAAGRRLVTFRKRGVINHRIGFSGREHDIVEVSGARLSDELRRRDFTINAVAFDPATGRLIDPRRGVRDLVERRIRAGSDAVFRDDPLRMIRAVRFWCELPGRFAIAGRTSRLIRRDAGLIGRVSPERVRDELDRILSSARPSAGIRRLDRFGLLSLILPEIEPLRGLAQNRYHHLDAWRHTLAALACADDPAGLARGVGLSPRPTLGAGDGPSVRSGEDLLILRWALLLHDTGKAGTRTLGEDGAFHFFGHERLSARRASEALRRLKMSKRRLRPVRRLIELHLRIAIPSDGELSERACRRVIRDAGELTPLLVLHALADKLASRGVGWRAALARLRRTGKRLVDLHREAGREILSPPRLLDGHDVMRILGIGPGERVGRLLAELRDLQVTGEIVDRDGAVAFVRSRGKSGAGGPVVREEISGRRR